MSYIIRMYTVIVTREGHAWIFKELGTQYPRKRGIQGTQIGATQNVT